MPLSLLAIPRGRYACAASLPRATLHADTIRCSPLSRVYAGFSSTPAPETPVAETGTDMCPNPEVVEMVDAERRDNGAAEKDLLDQSRPVE